jgi:predicted P-loop ATPase
LRDETGSCRFYPVRITRVDIDAILRDRDQLLGEALDCLEKARAAGEEWWRLPDAAQAILAALRESRTDDDPWTSVVVNFVDGLSEVAIPMIFEHHGEPKDGKMRPGLDVAKQDRNRGKSNAVAGILTRHGWTRDGKFTSGQYNGQARYVPPTDTE